MLIVAGFIQMVTDTPFAIAYYHYGTVVLASNAFCTWWNWLDYSLNGFLLFVMAWGSIERHLLIFHRNLMNTRRKRILFHFLPMSIAGLYPVVFYFAAIVLNSCQNQWNYDAVNIPFLFLNHFSFEI
jgi:hypothetical protein